MLPRKLKNFNLFVDGVGYAGRVEEAELPSLTRSTEEYRGGGMDAPVDIDMGQEKLEATLTLGEYAEDVLRLFGLQDGAGVTVKLKGSIERDDASGDRTPVLVEMRGRWKELGLGTWKAGDNTTLSVQVMATYFRYNSGGEDLIEIDVPNLVRRVNGEDQLAATRDNIGL